MLNALLKYPAMAARAFYWCVYFLSGFFPRSNRIWIFGGWNGTRFADNAKYMYLMVSRFHRKEVRAIWISKNRALVNELRAYNLEACWFWSIRGILSCLVSKVWVFDNKSDSITFWLSRGTIKINLWHGIPLKKIEWDDEYSKWFQARGIRKAMYQIVAPWIFEKANFYLCPSPLIAPIFKSAFRLDESQVVVGGYPRTYIFFEKIKGFDVQCAQEPYGRLVDMKSAGRRLIMYMPTFRDRSDELFLEIVNLTQFNEFLKERDLLFLIKPHPYSTLKDIPPDKYTNILSLEPELDGYPFLSLSDVLVTDYSSVYFDYLLLNKPIIFFCYDLLEYLQQNRQMYFEYEKITPGVKANNYDSLISGIKDVLNGSDGFSHDRQKMCKQMFSYRNMMEIEELFHDLEVRVGQD